MLTPESLWEVCALIFFLLAAGLFAACTRPASVSPVKAPTSGAPSITVESVQVNQGAGGGASPASTPLDAGVYVSGRSTLPDGECVKTELLAGGKAAEWWPRDVCVTVDSGQWEILAALGQKGAPERLDPGTAYEIHAWWPKNPAQTTTTFPFDLNGPKK